MNVSGLHLQCFTNTGMACLEKTTEQKEGLIQTLWLL